jgi:hypothetical protein
MKVFISWSGDLSHKVAQELRDWLPKVIQRVKPFISSRDIETGSRGNNDMAKELQDTSYGILCITKDNLQAPWINFEAGALSKFVDESRVTPYLFNLKGSDIGQGHPLLQFQYMKFEKEDVRKMLKELNKACEPDCLEESDLNEIFEMWWPKLEEKLNAILEASVKNNACDTEKRSQEDILEEVLSLVRLINNNFEDAKRSSSGIIAENQALMFRHELKQILQMFHSETYAIQTFLEELKSSLEGCASSPSDASLKIHNLTKSLGHLDELLIRINSSMKIRDFITSVST